MALHGSSAFIELAQRRYWDESRGATVERTWEGPTAGLATFISGTLPAGYSSINIDDDTELCVVSAVYRASDTDGIGSEESGGLVQRIWELDGNDIEKSLWEHPKVKFFTDAYDTEDMAALKAHYESILDGTATTSWADDDVREAMLRMARGTEAYTISQYVLRKTEVVRAGTSLAASHDNTNCRFDYTALTTAEPTLAAYNLVAAADLTALIWLKRTPDVRPTQNNLYEIITEYWGAEEWDTWIYPAAT